MIDSYRFGSFVIDGKQYSCNIKLIRDKYAGTWDHGPHIVKTEHVKDLVRDKPEIIIIGTGASGTLKVPIDVQEYIGSKGIRVIIQRSGEAINTYNELIKKGKRVNALMHNTC